MNPIRHGDIVLYPAPPIDTSQFEPIAGNSLATGSSTGHSHSVTPASAVSQFDLGDERRLLVLTSPAELSHDEHTTVQLDTGYYIVSHKRQYDADNGWVDVED